MAYTQGQLIEQVYLHITGGQPTEDFDVERIDIKTAIPAIMASVALIESRRSRLEAHQMRTSRLGVDPAWLITETFAVFKDEDRDQSYMKFEKKVTLLDNMYGIANVGAIKGNCVFAPTIHRFATAGIDREMRAAGVTMWYYEKVGNEERVYLKFLPVVVSEIWISYMPSFDDLEEDEIVPIPSGLELEVLQQAINFFQSEADKRADSLNNHNDDRNVPKRQ